MAGELCACGQPAEWTAAFPPDYELVRECDPCHDKRPKPPAKPKRTHLGRYGNWLNEQDRDD